MDKFRNLKNRLSVSVDKLSPNLRGRSPKPANRKSMNADGGPLSASTSADPIHSMSPSSPGVPVRRNRNRSARPSSMDESDVEDVSISLASSPPKSEVTLPPPTQQPARESTTPSKLVSETDSLVLEVLKEVEKIEIITDNIKKRNELENVESKAPLNIDDKIDFIDGADENPSDKEAQSISGINDETVTPRNDISEVSEDIVRSTVAEKLASIDPSLSGSSTLHAESVTSGYFTDSAPEISTAAPKPKPAATVFSTLSKIEDKPPAKKESIYSKLLRRKEEDKGNDGKSKEKEPIYARIKPKLKIDSGFKPIEPGSMKSSTQDSPVVKPEPIYSKVRPRIPGSPVTPISPIFSGSPRSSFVPLNPNGDPIYPKLPPKSSTLPGVAPITGAITKESKTLPKDVPMFSPRAKYPIYTQPLPALPTAKEENDNVQQSATNSVTKFSTKVTVREKEISPVRADVVTITNPAYVPSPPSSPRVIHSVLKSEGSVSSLTKSGVSVNFSPITETPPMSPKRRSRATRSNASTSSLESSNRKSQDLSTVPMMPPPKAPKFMREKRQLSKERTVGAALQKDNFGSDSCMSIGSEPESSGRILSKLVEELSIELEVVSRRMGEHGNTGEEAKKEVLSKLLATYDVPSNLRRVPEVDEYEALRSERFMIPVSSSDELRLVGTSNEHVDMFYGDLPDYSQDEFVIALDDENDPKYATLTNEMRQNQHRSLIDMSPGKVSRRSTQVYTNVVNVLSALKVLVNSNSTRAVGVISRMGTLARPYAKKVQTSVHTSVQDTSWIQRRLYHVTVSGPFACCVYSLYYFLFLTFYQHLKAIFIFFVIHFCCSRLQSFLHLSIFIFL